MNDVGMELRPATISDEPFVRALTRETMQESVYATWDDEASRERFFSSDKFVPEATWIIVVNGTPVGRVSVTENVREVRVDGIHLAPAIQGRGIGSAILGRLIEDAIESDKEVTAILLKNNPARALYERLGFNVVREDSRQVYLRIEP